MHIKKTMYEHINHYLRIFQYIHREHIYCIHDRFDNLAHACSKLEFYMDPISIKADTIYHHFYISGESIVITWRFSSYFPASFLNLYFPFPNPVTCSINSFSVISRSNAELLVDFKPRTF